MDNFFKALVAIGTAAEHLACSTAGWSRTAIVSARSKGRKAAGLERPFAASRSVR